MIESRQAEIEKKIVNLEKKIKKIEKHEDLSGVLVYKYIKCGKENCKCHEGLKHGPYLHLQTYDKNEKRIKTKYIKKKEENLYKEKYKENKEYVKITKELDLLYKELKKIKRGKK